VEVIGVPPIHRVPASSLGDTTNTLLSNNTITITATSNPPKRKRAKNACGSLGGKFGMDVPPDGGGILPERQRVYE
jgi:hypothetical protein